MQVETTEAVAEVVLTRPIAGQDWVPLRAPRGEDFAAVPGELLTIEPGEGDPTPLSTDEKAAVELLRRVGLPVDGWGDAPALAEKLGVFHAGMPMPFVMKRNMRVYAAWLERLSGMALADLEGMTVPDGVRCLEQVERLLIQHVGARPKH